MFGTFGGRTHHHAQTDQKGAKTEAEQYRKHTELAEGVREKIGYIKEGYFSLGACGRVVQIPGEHLDQWKHQQKK